MAKAGFWPRLPRTLLDPALNSVRKVCVNIYEAALLSAFKLFRNCALLKLRNGSLLRSLFRQCTESLVSVRIRRQNNEQSRQVAIGRDETKLLVLHAYMWVFANRFIFRTSMSGSVCEGIPNEMYCDIALARVRCVRDCSRSRYETLNCVLNGFDHDILKYIVD